MKLWFKALSISKKVSLAVGAFFAMTFVVAAASPAQLTVKPAIPQGSAVSRQEKLESKTEIEILPIEFQTETRNDNSLKSGLTKVSQEGVTGERTITYKVTLTNGKQTSKAKISDTVTKPAVNKVILNGTYIYTPPAATSCSGGYVNVNGNCIQSPSSSPAGASARCADGTYSYSQNRRGTCSYHGGVATWL